MVIKGQISALAILDNIPGMQVGHGEIMNEFRFEIEILSQAIIAQSDTMMSRVTFGRLSLTI